MNQSNLRSFQLISQSLVKYARTRCLAVRLCATMAQIDFDEEVSGGVRQVEEKAEADGVRLCILGDGEPRVSVNQIFCAAHKRVDNNLYNQVKSETGGVGEEWENFKKQKKDQSQDYLLMLLAATTAKTGNGAGKNTACFNALQHLRTVSNTSRIKSGIKRAFKTLVGFTTHAKAELGWSMSRVQLEWNYLKDKAGPDDTKTTVDRVTGDQVEWLHINMEEYTMAENEIAQTDEVQMQGALKKKPTTEVPCDCLHFRLGLSVFILKWALTMLSVCCPDRPMERPKCWRFFNGDGGPWGW
jgi:hypothetical protein